MTPLRFRWLHGSRRCSIRAKVDSKRVQIRYLDDRSTAVVLKAALRCDEHFLYGKKSNRKERATR